MKTLISSKTLTRSTAIVMGWIWLTAGSCSFTGTFSGTFGDNPIVPSSFPCTATPDPDFPIGASLTLNKPAVCPVKLLGATSIPYAANAELPAAGNAVYNYYEGRIINRQGIAGTVVTQAAWSQGNGKYFATITGNYVAALGGFDSNNRGYDEIQNRFLLSNGNWTKATARITYQYGTAANFLTAPSSVDPWQSYTVSAVTDGPLLVGPLTWSWYVDGVLAGTTSANEFTLQGGAPGTTQAVQAQATDPNGEMVQGTTFVYANTNCVDIYGNPGNCQ